MLLPVNEALATEIVHTTDAVEIFTTLLATHLIQHGTLKRPKRPHSTSDMGSHRPRSIVKLTRRLREIKNKKRKNFVQNPKPYMNAVRMFHKALRAGKQQDAMRSVRKQERAFRKNPWKFVCVCTPCGGRTNI